MDAVATKTVTALHGCFLIPSLGSLRITREWAAVQEAVATPAEIWDGRWQLIASAGENVEGLQIRALGQEGLAKIADWRDTGLPRQSLWASPAVWREDVLVSAPRAGFANGWKAELVRR